MGWRWLQILCRLRSGAYFPSLWTWLTGPVYALTSSTQKKWCFWFCPLGNGRSGDSVIVYKRGHLWGERSQLSSPPAKVLDTWRKPSRTFWPSHHLAEDLWKTLHKIGLPRRLSSRTLLHRQCRRCRRRGFDPQVEKIPWRRKWQPIWRKCQLQYCLESSVDRGAWQSTVHRFTKSWTRLSDWACVHCKQD